MRFQSKTPGGTPPVVLLLSYLILVAMDLYTTFVATPDLYYEENLLIRAFGLNWFSIIALTTAGVVLMSTAFVWSRRILVDPKTGMKGWRRLVATLATYLFFLHLIYSGIVVINNSLSIVYLYQLDIPIIKSLSDRYINIVKSVRNFYSFFQLSIVIIAAPISQVYLKRVQPEKSNRKDNGNGIRTYEG